MTTSGKLSSPRLARGDDDESVPHTAPQTHFAMAAICIFTKYRRRGLRNITTELRPGRGTIMETVESSSR